MSTIFQKHFNNHPVNFCLYHGKKLVNGFDLMAAFDIDPSNGNHFINHVISFGASQIGDTGDKYQTSIIMVAGDGKCVIWLPEDFAIHWAHYAGKTHKEVTWLKNRFTKDFPTIPVQEPPVNAVAKFTEDHIKALHRMLRQHKKTMMGLASMNDKISRENTILTQENKRQKETYSLLESDYYSLLQIANRLNDALYDTRAQLNALQIDKLEFDPAATESQ